VPVQAVPVRRKKTTIARTESAYHAVLADMVRLIHEARRASARAVNTVMTATYWEIGRRIVGHEQGGEARAGYGGALLALVSEDLTKRFGRDFSVDRFETARLFYLAYQDRQISATTSRKLSAEKSETLSRKSLTSRPGLHEPARLPLSWSHYWAQGRVLGRRSRRSAHRRDGDVPARTGRRLHLRWTAAPAADRHPVVQRMVEYDEDLHAALDQEEDFA
jgi:hypothetical protein